MSSFMNSIIVDIDNIYLNALRNQIMKTLGLFTLAALSLSACATGMNGGTTGNNQNNVVTQYPVEATLLNIYTKDAVKVWSPPSATKLLQQTLKSLPKVR